MCLAELAGLEVDSDDKFAMRVAGAGWLVEVLAEIRAEIRAVRKALTKGGK